MKVRSRENRSLNISNSRWLVYATASAASFVVGSQAAEGAIHYSGPVDVNLSGKRGKQATFQLDRPGDSIAFQHFYHSSYFAGFKVVGIQSAKFAGDEGIDYHPVNRLRRNKYVSHLHLTAAGSINEFASLVPGYFSERGVGYIGFEFNGGAGVQYGWARVHMDGPNGGYGFSVIDYAWADPGEPILTGQKSERGASESEARTTPLSGSLGLIAFGAAGLLGWRKVRGQVSA